MNLEKKNNEVKNDNGTLSSDKDIQKIASVISRILIEAAMTDGIPASVIEKFGL